ncbi:MAG: low molecular weight phosphatase family protein [Planktomarina sp.]|nr:low molecular weight phosphatase family protein [Planktomarina sp.]MDT1985499.1 low molecular weight phosphatase family protein [Planktomarina sp.]MDT2017283.1 low molecular weight phosphatase family protein [Planktomarina sp.]MDV3050162.1 low molecular weight phosphatase family protein [Planktomarina sp.]
MTLDLPQSILFCCDHNAVRSPMAEGLMKKFYGTDTYVQSAGVIADMDIDGFSIAVCGELGIELSRHKSRSFAEMHKLGDELSSFDLIVALSPASQIEAEKITNFYDLKIEYWPIFDPTSMEEDREKKLIAYRQARDQIIEKLTTNFGAPN